MTRDELLQLHEQICNNARSIMAAKNADYSGANGDCFANFRGAAFLGMEPEIGLLMRMMDKFKRIESFVAKGTLQVKNEPVDDAILDLVNYSILLAGLIRERAEDVKPIPSTFDMEVPILVRFADENGAEQTGFVKRVDYSNNNFDAETCIEGSVHLFSNIPFKNLKRAEFV